MQTDDRSAKRARFGMGCRHDAVDCPRSRMVVFFILCRKFVRPVRNNHSFAPMEQTNDGYVLILQATFCALTWLFTGEATRNLQISPLLCTGRETKAEQSLFSNGKNHCRLEAWLCAVHLHHALQAGRFLEGHLLLVGILFNEKSGGTLCRRKARDTTGHTAHQHRSPSSATKRPSGHARARSAKKTKCGRKQRRTTPNGMRRQPATKLEVLGADCHPAPPSRQTASPCKRVRSFA